MREIDAIADSRVRSFVDAVQARFPGLLESVVVTGSAATDDWHEARSDIDLILVTWRRLSAGDAAALAELHLEASDPTPFDAVYLTVEQFADGPDAIRAAPQVVDGRFTLEAAGGQLSWVTWLEAEGAPHAEMSRNGMGEWKPLPAVRAGAIARAGEASRANLLSYWRSLGRSTLGSRFAAESTPVAAEAIAWIVLGPPRLNVTIEEGRIASKTEAGRFAAAQWPRFAALIDRVIHWRRTGEGEFTLRDGREARALLRLCVARGSR